MSGDVQPRKRKDKKKKRDDEASHGVHVTKMGSDDVLLHVHEEHGTGGHWCAKIIFFSLMAILLGLVCLIILENRGISDVDTPLSESRFSNYFDGWVDEHRDDHDDHHDSHGSLEHDDHEANEEHDDDEDDHDEPFEEEADHSEGDDEELAEEEDDNVTPEEEEDDGTNATAENVTAEEDAEEEDDEEEDTVTAEMDDNVTAEEADEENATGEDDNVTKEITKEQNEDDDDDDNDDEGEDEDDNATKETSNPASQAALDDDDDPFDEDDEDSTFDSLEKIVDNDAAELELLKEKARQQAAESKQTTASAENDLEDQADNAPSWASSLTIKIGVGLALALVARLVLIRKKPISNEDEAAEFVMKRRLTIATPEESIPECGADTDEPPPEDDYSEEEIEIEEEIEFIEDEVEPAGEENQIDAGDNDYVPETFEQLNEMYRPKDKTKGTEQKNDTKPLQSETYSNSSPFSTTSNNNNNENNAKSRETTAKIWAGSNEKYHTQEGATQKLAAPIIENVRALNAPLKYSPPKGNTAKTELPPAVRKEITFDMDYEKSEKEKPVVEQKKEIAHDMDYEPTIEDIDYDEDDIYDDEDDGAQVDDSEEDLDEEDILDDEADLEQADDEEVSDIDDSELMNRLEAKYGKLPAKEYESDEDPDDPTWTRNY